MSRRDFVPRISEVTRPYWEATRRQELVLQQCRRCGKLVHHPREACPHCLSRELDWVTSTGTGTVHARSIHYRPFEAMGADDCPYVVAFIDLDHGVRFLSNLVGEDRETIAPGSRVELGWEPIGEGYHLPVFRTMPA
jgi:uncharacterized OB-fold protein